MSQNLHVQVHHQEFLLSGDLLPPQSCALTTVAGSLLLLAAQQF